MDGEVFVKITLSVISIVSALITAFVIPYIKNKIGIEKLDQINYYAEKAVKCAEQIFTPDEWKEKKAYVMKFVYDICVKTLKIDISYEQLDTIVEGIVYQVKKE